MRVVVDANVFLSFLIFPKRSTAASTVVIRAIAGDFVLVFPSEIADEMRSKVREKPYFRDRIDPAQVEALLTLIAQVALAPSAGTTAPVSSRDPKDDYLLAAAAGDGVEFLVTGDRDLLDIVAPVGYPMIVTPAQFLYLLDSEPTTGR